jgi:hypothetical protein
MSVTQDPSQVLTREYPVIVSPEFAIVAQLFPTAIHFPLATILLEGRVAAASISSAGVATV